MYICIYVYMYICTSFKPHNDILYIYIYLIHEECSFIYIYINKYIIYIYTLYKYTNLNMYPQSHVIHTCVFKNIRCRYDFCIHVDIYNTLFLIFTISQSHIYTQIYIYIYTYTHFLIYIYIYTSQCHGEI